MLDRTRCPACGHPTWLSHDKVYRKAFVAKGERCFSCDSIASKQKVLSGDNVHNPGAIHYRTEFVGYSL